DTVVGCAVVLVFGYLLWPDSRKPKIGGLLADAVDQVAEYAGVALRSQQHGRNIQRRKTYRQLSDLRTELQRVLVERSAARRLAAAGSRAIIGLERVTNSLPRVAVEIRQGLPPPEAEHVDRVVGVLRDIAASVRAQRAPADPPDVRSDQLAGV